jgi:hypothetical protein
VGPLRLVPAEEFREGREQLNSNSTKRFPAGADLLLSIKKIEKKDIVKPNSCIYLQPNGFINKISKQTRRDVFQAVADPTRRAIILLIASQAMTPKRSGKVASTNLTKYY